LRDRLMALRQTNKSDSRKTSQYAKSSLKLGDRQYAIKRSWKPLNKAQYILDI